MSYFDDASLVMIPSGYKTSKVYSVKPTDGSGDLTFSRSNDTATRVNSAGLIEKVRTNVALYSEQFNNANWGPTNATVTANTTTAPDGTTTADSVAFTASSSARLEGLTAGSSPAGEITLSIYAKVASGTGSFRLRGDWSGGNSISTDFAVTTSWQRFTHTFTAASALQIMSLYNNTAGTAQTIIFWGAQAESGVTTPYIGPTTSAAVSVGPVANVPRLDYLNSSCPRLLLEPQRTSLVTFSESIDNAAWSKFGSTSVTANTAVSPDGYTNADTINTSGAEVIRQLVTLAASTVYTYSVFVKKTNYDLFGLQNLVNGTGVKSVFNLSTGVVSSQGSGHTASIVSYGNGWYRCIVTFNSGSSTSNIFDLAADGSSSTLRAFYCYGAMAELGAYATSYIPTLGAAVTRGADAASKTSASALIGQTEGTIFWEFQLETPVATGHEDILNIDNGSFGNTIYMTKTAAGYLASEVYNSGLQASFSVSATTAGTYKAALGYANNNTAFFLNGVQVGITDTSCSIPATSRIQLGNGALGPSTGLTKQVLLFPTRLSNSDLAALTA